MCSLTCDASMTASFHWLWQTNYAPYTRLPWAHVFFSFLASGKPLTRAGPW
jgi:hypothetical protein